MMYQLTSPNQKPSCTPTSTTTHDLFHLNGTGDPCLESADQSAEFTGHSIEDQRFIQLQRAGVCDRQGIAVAEHSRNNFSKIPKGKAVHDLITERIKNTGISTRQQSPTSTPSIQDLIIEMFQISLVDGLEETENGLYLVWPAAITEVRLGGLSIWQLLFKHPEHFQEQIDHAFSSAIPPQMIKEFFSSRKMKDSEEHSLLSFEVIWKGSKDHFKPFSQKMLKFLQENSPLLPENFVINEEVSSIDIKCSNQTLRFVFSTKSVNHSSEDCLSVLLFRLSHETNSQNGTIVIHDHLLTDLELTTGPFSPAQVLIDELCQFYRPVNTAHQDVLLNLLYHGKKMISGIEEKELVNQFIGQYRSIGDEQAFIRHASPLRSWKGEKFNQLAQRKTTESFSSGQEEYLARVLYFHTRRKIESERQNHFNSNNPPDVFEFLLRLSQSLSMHSSVDDRVINQLWQWFYEDQLITPSENPLQNTIQELLIIRKIKFSEFSACLTSLSMIYYSNRFSQRQNPPIYFIEEPFVMRVPPQPVEAFSRLNEYLASHDQAIEVFKLICKSFVPYGTDEGSCNPLAFPRIGYGELRLTNEVIQLMDHPDPFVSYLGFQAGMLMPNLKNPLLFYAQLPKILSEDPNNPRAIHTLFQRTKERHGIDSNSNEASVENPL